MTTPFLTTDPSQAYDHFAPLVAALPDDRLTVWHADDDLIRTNVGYALAALAPTDAALVELPTLALALTFAAGKAEVPVDKKELHDRQARLRLRRSATLRQAEIFVDLELIPGATVQAIRAGSGGIDEAKDGFALATIFQRAEFAGMHPFKPEYLAGLLEDSNWLLAALSPTSAKKAHAERTPAERVRDQLFAELNARYDDLYAAGVKKWGRHAVDAHIPPLLQRAHAPHVAAKPVTPAVVEPAK